jgi:dTDP-4-dehydrorhamnose reductase
MRILILGAAGMLGHKLWQIAQNRFETWATVRSSYNQYLQYDLFDSERLLDGVDVYDLDTVAQVFAKVQPQVVINCVGIVKQLPTANNPIASLSINSLIPHQLAELCQEVDARLIHISTDCVFSGHKGMYAEDDVSDAEDFYGRTKFLGEIDGPGCLTLRTSLIGRELCSSHGLVEWFLSNRGGKVRGYSRAIFSGFTTLVTTRIIGNIIEHHSSLSGIYHVSSDPINKNDLLCLLRDTFGVQIEIELESDVQIDRSLDGKKFQRDTGFVPPSWPEMIQEMADDPTPYEQWRKDL